MIPNKIQLNTIGALLFLTRYSSAQDAAAASETPTECNYDDSLGDYLSCEKAKYTTTQLVGAGIGVTLLIFALAFGGLYFLRRRRAPVKKSKDDEEKAKRDGEESDDEDEDDDDDDETDTDDDEDDDRKDNKGPHGDSAADDSKGRHSEKHDDAKPPKYSRSARVEDEEEAGDSLPRQRATDKSLPPAPDDSKMDESKLRPPSRHAPASNRSSRVGSPTEPPVRNLYPSNPDQQVSKRDTLKPPSRPARPHTTIDPSPRDEGLRPPMPVQRSSSTKARRLDDEADVRSIDNRPTAPQTRSTPSQNPDRRESMMQPPRRPQTVTRSSTAFSTDSIDSARTSYENMPLPARPTPARTSSRASSTFLPPRSSSRMSMSSSRQSSLVPDVPDVPEVPKASVGAAPVRRSVRASRHPNEMRAASVSVSVHETEERERR